MDEYTVVDSAQLSNQLTDQEDRLNLIFRMWWASISFAILEVGLAILIVLIAGLVACIKGLFGLRHRDNYLRHRDNYSWYRELGQFSKAYLKFN